MSRIAFSIAISLVPMIASAQARTQASVSASADARVQARGRDSSSYRIPSRYSVESRTKIEATLVRADRERLPRRAIEDRIAEGEAKGAAEAQVVMQSGRMLARLEAAHDAMVKAGRAQPSDEETTRGAEVLAHGYTESQLEAVTRSANPNRGLTTALETLVSLRAQGQPVDRAIAAVSARLEKNASDEQIASLGTVNAAANANAHAAGSHGAAGAAAGVTGAANAGLGNAASAVGASATGAAGAAGHVGGVAGSATGAVSGVVRKP